MNVLDEGKIWFEFCSLRMLIVSKSVVSVGSLYRLVLFGRG